MRTLEFVYEIVKEFQNENGLLEPDIDDLRDFVVVTCWSVVQMNQIHQAMLHAESGVFRQYNIVSHTVLDSHLLLVAKGIHASTRTR